MLYVEPTEIIRRVGLFSSVLNVQSWMLETSTWFLVNVINGTKPWMPMVHNCLKGLQPTNNKRNGSFVDMYSCFRLDWRGWNLVFD